MSEKRVSVRLSATGGRQVKAELEGVGEAGKRGFGRLSREMDSANALIAAVEAMLNGVAGRINGFLATINAGLAALGSERQISVIGTLELGRLENSFEGAAAGAGTAAREAFDAAFSTEPLSVPDPGFGDFARSAQANAQVLQDVLSDVSAAATAPLGSVAALSSAVAASGAQAEASLGAARSAAASLEEALTATMKAFSGTWR